MRVLVTGASGLVGGRLLVALAGDGILLRAASRAPRTWPAGVEGVVIDLDAPSSLAAACDGVDAVVNLAAMPEAACAADPRGALRANTGGTQALVAAAVRAGVARFVQLSTAKVYGNNPEGTVTEQTTPRPASHYAITHRASEDYATLHPAAVVLRLANGFGAPAAGSGRGWDLIANDFCRQAATSRRIAIRSDGTAWRNFVPLNDVVAALGAAIWGLPAGTYNLGSACSMTLRAMAERVARACEEALGFRPEVSVGDPGPEGPGMVLDLRSDRLRDAGVRLGADIDEEIVRTLIAARERIAVAAHD
jgi:UDP-glucose 4-epimerase